MLKRVIVSLCLLGLMISGSTAVRAQDASTPAAGDSGVVIQNLAVSLAAGAPEELLSVYRITVPTGAEIPAFSQPGTAVLYVEEGTVNLNVMEGDTRGDLQIFYRGEEGTMPSASPGAGAPQTEEGTIVLEAGDSAILGPSIVRSIQNQGEEQAVLFVSAVLQGDMAPFQFVDGASENLPQEIGVPVTVGVEATPEP